MKIEELINIITEIADDDEIEVNADMALLDDLGFDSLQYIDIVVMLESKFGLSIQAEKLAEIKTIRQLHEACLEVA